MRIHYNANAFGCISDLLRSLKDIEEIMSGCGVTLTSKIVRELCLKLGNTFAKKLKQNRSQIGDKWHLDEMFIKINA